MHNSIWYKSKNFKFITKDIRNFFFNKKKILILFFYKS